MDTTYGLYLIGGIGALVLLIGLAKKNVEWLLNIIIRVILGIVCICVLNKVAANLKIFETYNIEIGINLITLLTSGILGIPGIIGLYILKIYGLL